MTNNKAFLFDMDGVIIRSEHLWEKYESIIYKELIGTEKYHEIKDELIGLSGTKIAEYLTKIGHKISSKELHVLFESHAIEIYSEATITPKIEELFILLKEKEFKLALVSSALQEWIDIVMKRTGYNKYFEFGFSVESRKDLEAKPSPSGYIQAMKDLDVKPENTIILEDSNNGIKAAKGSGALAICLRENLPEDYKSKGADIYVERVGDILKLIDVLGG